MANAAGYKKASFNRKVLYFGLIAALFVATLVVRGVRLTELQAGQKWTVTGQADDLKLSTLSRGGETQLSGSAVRLLLTGSQGLVTCGLWIAASELQKQQEWNKLELLVDSVTKLQPYFETPWLFQSWNLSYNVSVELDRLNDMYFYISRGISLLAEGESINTDNPNMRYYIAFYYQNKFSVSDKVNTLRCMYNLSCIPPDGRKYQDLLEDDGRGVNPERFLEFCRRNPQLVRRLKESTVALSTPQEIVQFLKENVKIPSRYRDGQNLDDIRKQFPVLPPPFLSDDKEELTPKNPIGDRDADALLASRAWFHYSTMPLPPPNGRPIGLPTDEMRAKYKIPKQPMTIIFLQGAPRAQTYVAERLQKEGWFDADPWKVDEYNDTEEYRTDGSSSRWFGGDVALDPTMHSQEAYDKAYRMWASHGQNWGLNYDKAQQSQFRQKAMLFAQRRGISPDGGAMVNPPPSPEELADPELRDSYEALMDLVYFRQNLGVTNFKTFLYSTEAEMSPETVNARKLFFQADRYRKLARTVKARELYEKAFPLWKDLLVKKPYFHRGDIESNGREGDKVQEDSYEAQIDYLDLVTGPYMQKRREAILSLHDILNSAGAAATGNPLQILGDISLWDAVRLVPVSDRLEPLPVAGPLDGDDPTGRPWIYEDIKARTRQRLAGLKPAAGPAPKPTESTMPKGP